MVAVVLAECLDHVILEAVAPIWHISQNFGIGVDDWARINSGQLSSNIVLVILITKFVEIHFVFFVVVTRQ
jgi:hypothetical protein